MIWQSFRSCQNGRATTETRWGSCAAGQPASGQRLVQPVLKAITRLHDVGAERDHAGNRKLFYDQYVTLLLMCFCNLALESLRACSRPRAGRKPGRRWASNAQLRVALRAARVFDAERLRPVVQELAAQAVPLSVGREAEALKGLTAVDGSIFAGLSRMAWAAPGGRRPS